MIETIKDQELVLHCEAMLSSCHKLRDGGERVLTIRVSKEDSAVLDVMMARNNGMTAHAHIALAEVCPSSGEFINQHLIIQKEIQANANPKTVRHSPRKSKGSYGKQAQLLKTSAFFRTKKVWEQIASDNHYMAWCRKQPCAFTKQPGNKHGEPIEAAHVRRSNECGTGIKPTYATIPLLKSVHARQHSKGELSIQDSELWDKARLDHVTKWAWQTLRGALGYESWAAVPPIDLYKWAERHKVEFYLPRCYKTQNEPNPVD